ncbi:PrsW family intramembrane metalloprotease [Corynebacterium sp. BF-R-2]|uniref:PrsW family intramembrane metalloprotease n=1 Tax=Corynebacterium sp. BF-R-2 TaxID=2943494 RepID=UPI00211E9C42|nr:PrsW family intramembrane metalloprotease [Corynebacterium sp. BF-R-2]MCQ9677777.1 PrsW family intramembrane metalloprotease [Corynebacterium sp. BF-R-2]
MKYLYYLLTLGALGTTVLHYTREPFLPASVLTAVIFGAVVVSLTLFLLRRRPGIAHGVVWGFAVSGLAVEINTNMTHLLARSGLDWLGAAGYAPLNEEVLKFLGVVLICTCVIRPRSWRDYVFVGVAVGIGFAAGENATAFARMTVDNLDSDTAGAISAVAIRLMSNPLSHALFTGLSAYGLSQKQPVRWLIIAIAVHTTKNLFPSLSSTFDDAIWPLLAGLLVVVALWVATIWGIIALRKKAAANPTLSPAPARA